MEYLWGVFYFLLGVTPIVMPWLIVLTLTFVVMRKVSRWMDAAEERHNRRRRPW
jgi:hypothetical protein